MTPDLADARRHFADELRVTAHMGNERLVEAFAAVPRERFAGPGPWRILNSWDGYWTTPDNDPRWLYHNVLVALDETRRLNIGEPNLWAYQLDRIALGEGERVLQIGTGSGYFTAILAETVGRGGRVDAIEIDEDLAARATHNLESWPAAVVHQGDAAQPVDGQWDVIVAFAGATAPQAWWLDALADGGRLLLPMTTVDFSISGFMLRLDRRGETLAARSVGRVGFYPCIGARTPEGETALRQALADPAGQQALTSLRRDRHDKDDSCWLHRDDWCLSKRPLSPTVH
ncbi:protein-L-isoaspartate O-methyltransferase family protein [Reyranella soli]|jgi:protein-L-isoaspartate(D-aspartate) O-methyltransferase|uniref:Protein-L-isoaspartate O-methyltransferase n=1 Tax=Reyranella soli TaxID=1230389 RepID=A0A512N491_9HYPH|nr:methyltransferase domain-containing protein [Reyranella soli]GEP53796.1 O-methyltransferase [Reyranella soli]